MRLEHMRLEQRKEVKEMRYTIRDETLESLKEYDIYRRTWYFECGCVAEGSSATHMSAGWSGVRVIPCPAHTRAFEDVNEFRWPEDLFEYMAPLGGYPNEA